MLYLFISSLSSVTPTHVVMIWDRHDRDTVTEEELEALVGKPESVDTTKARVYEFFVRASA
jgi:hypothetical protein